MTTAAVMMVKDEADIVESTIRHLTGQVALVIVADNGSTDGTRAILDRLEHELPIIVLDDPEPAYYQSQKMSALAEMARDHGADWIVPCDADEIWYSPFGTIADVLSSVHSEHSIAPARLYDHVVTATDDATIADPVHRIQWRRSTPGQLPKVAARAHDALVIEQGNHGAHHADGSPAVRVPGGELLVVRHFPYRSVQQMVSKARNGAAAYAATNLPEDTGAHWRGYGRVLEEFGEQGIADIFHEWFYSDDPVTDLLVFDPAIAAVEAACA